MGQMANMDRALRFINAFQDLVNKVAPVKGETLVVKSAGLGTSESGGEEVRAYVTCEHDDGEETTLCMDDVLFDPEYGPDDDEQIEQLAETFGITPEEVTERLQKADLIDN